MELKNCRVAIWGTGAFGAMAYEGLKSRYGNTPSIYIDFNTENQGKKFLNTNVISPKEICNEEFDYICICALNSDYIIKNYLSNEQKKKLINPKELVYEINYEDVENKFTTNSTTLTSKYFKSST